MPKKRKQQDKPNLRVKLRATIEAKRISRSGLDNAEERLKELRKQRKHIKKDTKENVEYIDFLIEVLDGELNKIEEASANMQFSGPSD
jgi:hypothetical protein